MQFFTVEVIKKIIKKNYCSKGANVRSMFSRFKPIPIYRPFPVYGLAELLELQIQMHVLRYIFFYKGLLFVVPLKSTTWKQFVMPQYHHKMFP